MEYRRNFGVSLGILMKLILILIYIHYHSKVWNSLEKSICVPLMKQIKSLKSIKPLTITFKVIQQVCVCLNISQLCSPCVVQDTEPNSPVSVLGSDQSLGSPKVSRPFVQLFFEVRTVNALMLCFRVRHWT